jgi:hypothetical protein
MKSSLLNRLWAKVEVGLPHQCWPFTGYCRDGYGRIGLGTREQGVTKAASVVTEQFHGLRPSPRHQVRHLCRNRPCCNPTHLAWGTQSDNERDKIAHGVSNRGEGSGHARLTEEKVLGIRAELAAGESMHALGRRYGVAWQTIQDIAHRRTWAWLEGGDADVR